jgi:hypothetical protein
MTNHDAIANGKLVSLKQKFIPMLNHKMGRNAYNFNPTIRSKIIKYVKKQESKAFNKVI